MTQPRVSVVIPVHDGEAFLEAAIASVLAQSISPSEVIIVDDGSTDRTAGIAQARPEVRYIYQENSGPASARNRGVAVAGGELIAFLDADDTWATEKLARQVHYLQTHGDIGFVLCHMRCLLEPGARWPATLSRAHYESDPPAIVPSALLARKAAMERVGPFDASFACTDDSDWFFRARDAAVRHHVLPEVLLFKRIRHESVSMDSRRVRQELLRQARASAARRRTGG